MQPTVFDLVDVYSRLVQEEAFRPVVGIARARQLDEAIVTANAVGCGLAARVVTNAVGRASRLARRTSLGACRRRRVVAPTRAAAIAS